MKGSFVMSLDYRLPEGMTNGDISDDDWNYFQSLVFNTIPVGINRITEDNVDKFWERTFIFYRMCGDSKPYFTREFLNRFIGLSTNASPKTDAQFRKTMFEMLENNVKQAIKNEAK